MKIKALLLKSLEIKVRVLLSNFGVVLTIVIMVTLDYFVGLDTPKLHVPSTFHVNKTLILEITLKIEHVLFLKPTIPNRGWVINPLERNKGKWWLVFVAIPPALLAAILIFMDQNITVLIVNRKANKLKVSNFAFSLFIYSMI